MAADDVDELMKGAASASIAKRILYLLLAGVSVAPAAYLFVSIFLVDVGSSTVTLAAGITLGSVILSLAYHNLAIARAVKVGAGTSAPTKSAFKGKKPEYEAALAAHDAKVSAAAMSYSLYYNNMLFLVAAPFVGCYVFNGKVSGDLNLLLSSGVASSLALFNSRSALKALSQ